MNILQEVNNFKHLNRNLPDFFSKEALGAACIKSTTDMRVKSTKILEAIL